MEIVFIRPLTLVSGAAWGDDALREVPASAVASLLRDLTGAPSATDLAWRTSDWLPLGDTFSDLGSLARLAEALRPGVPLYLRIGWSLEQGLPGDRLLARLQLTRDGDPALAHPTLLEAGADGRSFAVTQAWLPGPRGGDLAPRIHLLHGSAAPGPLRVTLGLTLIGMLADLRPAATPAVRLATPSQPFVVRTATPPPSFAAVSSQPAPALSWDEEETLTPVHGSVPPSAVVAAPPAAREAAEEVGGAAAAPLAAPVAATAPDAPAACSDLTSESSAAAVAQPFEEGIGEAIEEGIEEISEDEVLAVESLPEQPAAVEADAVEADAVEPDEVALAAAALDALDALPGEPGDWGGDLDAGGAGPWGEEPAEAELEELPSAVGTGAQDPVRPSASLVSTRVRAPMLASDLQRLLTPVGGIPSPLPLSASPVAAELQRRLTPLPCAAATPSSPRAPSPPPAPAKDELDSVEEELDRLLAADSDLLGRASSWLD